MHKSLGAFFHFNFCQEELLYVYTLQSLPRTSVRRSEGAGGPELPGTVKDGGGPPDTTANEGHIQVLP